LPIGIDGPEISGKRPRCAASDEVSAFGAVSMLAQQQGSAATDRCRLAATPALEIAYPDKLP
jgi:hypothetical protein